MTTDCVIAIGVKIFECLVEPVLITPLRPIFCFKSIVNAFHTETRNLELKKGRVESAVNQARNRVHEMDPHVHKWLVDAVQVMEAGQILQSKLDEKRSRCSLGWTCRYKLSKQVREHTDTIKKHCGTLDESQHLVSHPIDLLQHIELPQDFVFSESASSALFKVTEALLIDDRVSKIGLYSMGGAGKTTLAKLVFKEAIRSNIFYPIMVTVPPNLETTLMIRKIQDEIAGLLNLTLQHEGEEGRAAKLRHRLGNGQKILVIVDDVLEELDLAKVGIPSSGSCKVLVTTNDLSVCNSMKTELDIQLGTLSEDEAWCLFKSFAGVDDLLGTDDVTKKVVSFCNGLPKALVMVGGALRGRGHSSWEDGLQQFKNDQVKPVLDLQKENEKLCMRKQSVQNEVEMAKNKGEEIKKEVKTWLASVERVMQDSKKLLGEFKENNSYFGEWHMVISKNTLEQCTESVMSLYTDGGFDRVSLPVPIRQYMGLSSSEDFMVSQSMNSAFHQVMDALGKEDVNVIGLYGMGGIGKTSLAEHICKEVERSRIFNCAVMVTVSQTPEIRKIQGVIADFLNLELKQESEEGRASKLNQRLGGEKILIILDDVWEKFDLTKIGIYGGKFKGCKILVTTRLLDVCTSSMQCQTTIKLDLFCEDEAWEFFRKKAGLSDNSNSNDVAKQIVGECGGLPIALASIGLAMRNKSKKDLERALKKLRDARLLDIPRVGGHEKNAYQCLRVSYDYLTQYPVSGEAQFLLLLCSLFPEDHEISVEELTRCAFGMRLFDHVDSVQEAREEVAETLKCLIDSCLLLGTNKKGVVKIHDVVRDAALWIGGTESPERSVFVVRDGKDMRKLMTSESLKNCRAISLMPNIMSELTEYKWVCPKLEALLIFGGEGVVALPDTFFKNTTALKVLDVRGRGIREMCDFPVPQSLQNLTDLRTVNIRWCRCSNSCFVGEIKKLEILSVIDSEVDCAIEAVFREMKKLKLLDLTRPSSNVIKAATLSSNVITELSNLKELYTYPGYSFGDGESSNIVEVHWIRNLVRLSAHIVGWRYLPIDFCFRDDLECYSMIVGPNEKLQLGYDRVLCLDEMEQRSQLQAFKNLFPGVEYLQLRNLRLGKGFKNIIPCWVNALVASESFLQNLKELKVLNSDELEALFELKYICKEPTTFFPCNLTHVVIINCPKLKTIFSSALCIAPSLQQLQVLFIQSCYQLEELISASADSNDDFSSCFQNLRELGVYKCSNLKAIFHILGFPLPKLQKIYLHGNGKLEHVFDPQTEKTVAGAMQWPSLELLSVSGCPKLSSDFVANIQTQLQAPSKAKELRTIKLANMKGIEKIIPPQNLDEDDLELLTFHLKKLELDNLQDLKCVWSHAKHNICFSYLTQVTVSNCNKLKQLFMIAIAPSLKQLKRLEVLDCKELEEIISIDNLVTEEKGKESVSNDETNMISITFPQLKGLKLKGLPSLIEFCPPNYNLVFPSLSRSESGQFRLQLEGCPRTITDFFCSQRVTLKGENKPQIM